MTFQTSVSQRRPLKRNYPVLLRKLAVLILLLTFGSNISYSANLDFKNKFKITNLLDNDEQVTNGNTSCGGDITKTSLANKSLKMMLGGLFTSIQDETFFTSLDNNAVNEVTQPGRLGLTKILPLFFKHYNSLLVGAAGLWIAIQLVLALFSISEAGGFKQSQYSFIWGPARIALVTIFLFPIYGGYSVLQGVVTKIAYSGSHTADIAACEIVDKIVVRPAAVTPTIPLSSMVIKDLLNSVRCQIEKNRDGTYLYNYSSATSAALANQRVPVFIERIKSTGIDTKDGKVSTYQGLTSNVKLKDVKGKSEGDGFYYKLNFIQNPIETEAAYADSKSDNVCGGMIMSASDINEDSVVGLQSGLLDTKQLISARKTMVVASEKALEDALKEIYKTAILINLFDMNLINKDNGKILSDKNIRQALGIDTFDGVHIINGQTVTPGAIPQDILDMKKKLISKDGIRKANDAFQQALWDGMAQAAYKLGNHESIKKVKEIIRRDGWVMFGSIWMGLNQASVAITESMKITYTRIPVSVKDSSTTFTKMSIFVESIMLVPLHVAHYVGNAISNQYVNAKDLVNGTTLSGMTEKIILLPVNILTTHLSPITKDSAGRTVTDSYFLNAKDTVIKSIEDLKYDPLLVSMRMGRDMLSIGLIFLMISLLTMSIQSWMTTTSEAEKNSTSYKNGTILDYISQAAASSAINISWLFIGLVYLFKGALAIFFLLGTVMMPIAIAMIIPGFLFTVFLPYLMFFTFYIAVIGWLLMIAQSLLATPLWVLLHANLKGEGLAHHTTQMGYQLLMGLVFRPILIMGGTIFAIIIAEIAAWLYLYFFTLFLPYVGLDGANHSQGIANAFIASALVITLYMGLYQVIKMCITLITMIPDEVLSWVGAGRDPLGGQMAANVLGGQETAGKSAQGGFKGMVGAAFDKASYMNPFAKGKNKTQSKGNREK